MNKKSRILALCWAVAFVLCGTAARAAQGPGACVTCHTFLGGELARPIAEWNGSIHQQTGITCDLCHGGDASVDVGNVKELAGQGFADRILARHVESQGLHRQTFRKFPVSYVRPMPPAIRGPVRKEHHGKGVSRPEGWGLLALPVTRRTGIQCRKCPRSAKAATKIRRGSIRSIRWM